MSDNRNDLCIDERHFIVEEEAVLSDVLADLDWLMESKSVNRRKLSERLGVSEARVSQMFSSNGRNMTLRTLARLFYALGEHLQITSAVLESLRKAAASADNWSICESEVEAPGVAMIANLWLSQIALVKEACVEKVAIGSSYSVGRRVLVDSNPLILHQQDAA